MMGKDTTNRCLSLLLVLLFLVGCGADTAEPPTRLPLAIAPHLPTLTPTNSALPHLLPSQPEAAATIELAPMVEATAVTVPTPAGVGLRPEQAQQLWVPDAGPSAPLEWRPPPYQVPLSLHPDDHYWLSRPIPSDRRNYDLEWYPFGHDVLIPELAPYRIHHGLDFPNDRGTPVLAAGSGVVVHAGPLPSPRDGVNYYGNTVIIKHDWQWQGQDVYTLYAHTLELFVSVGDVVQQGQLLAGVGSSGEVSGPHLHLEVRVGLNVYGDARNPALWLAPFEGWGTLAGRFVDRRGRPISGALITVRPVDVVTPVRVQRTYDLSVRSDDVWQENFVVGDLPAGRYTLQLTADGNTYRRNVTVWPGRTSFEIVSSEFEFFPTATPDVTPTLVITGTLDTAGEP
jgi:murein DD-endopeptidase MepM/ murein hydrolase activator NlpD